MKSLLLAGAAALAILAVQPEAVAAGRDNCIAVDVGFVQLGCDKEDNGEGKGKVGIAKPEPTPEPEPDCKAQARSGR